jgi:hypothetical protein
MKKTNKTRTSTVVGGRGNKNIHDILQYAIQSKRFIGGLCKLEKDGSISKINGQVFVKRTTAAGDEIVIIDNFLHKQRPGQKKRWQAVLVKNLLEIKENKWSHKKVA